MSAASALRQCPVQPRPPRSAGGSSPWTVSMALRHVLLELSFRSRGGVWTSTECHVCVSSLNVILHRSIGGISNLRASAFWASLDQSKTWVNNSYDASDILIGLLMRDFYLFCTFPCLSCEAVPGLVLYWSAPFPYRVHHPPLLRYDLRCEMPRTTEPASTPVDDIDSVDRIPEQTPLSLAHMSHDTTRADTARASALLRSSDACVEPSLFALRRPRSACGIDPHPDQP